MQVLQQEDGSWEMSQRRAARLVGCDPKTLRRVPDRRDDHIRERLRHHAAERRRFGYRRLGLMLERENITMNEKKLYRLYKEEGLAVRRRRGRKRATGTRPLVSESERRLSTRSARHRRQSREQ